jgi:parallel beta-helix repeat protein
MIPSIARLWYPLADGGSRSRVSLRIIGGAACVAVCVAAAAIPSPAGPAAAHQTAHETPSVAAAFGRTFVVTSLRDSGPGTLRWALTLANAGRWPTATATIRFRVRGTITLLRPLPVVSRPVIIDGTTAPAYRRGGPPVVAINFNFRPGLWFAAGSARSQLLGLALDHAAGNGVTLMARSITLNNDYIGLGLRGQPAGNRGDGVYVSPSSSGDLIGLNRGAAVGVVANVISGNRGNGIEMSGSSGNTVVSNRIGTSPSGSQAIPNGGNGIVLAARSNGNEIGGTAFVDKATGQANNPTGDKGTVTPVFVVPPLGNQISGNSRNGVLIALGSRNNVLNGNFIGTTPDGDGRIANLGNGVWIDRANNNELTGCKFVNNPFVYYNVVSGNGENGLRITNSDNSVVQGNFFGSAANNSTTVANRLDGILVDGSSGNTQVGGVIPLGNVSAGNGRNGIEVTGRAHGFTTFNTFGGLHAFGAAAPNGNDGLLVTATGGDNLARTNVMSGNRHNGIEIGGNASGVTVDPDIVGLDTYGTALLPNDGDGVLVDGTAHDNVIGGTRRSVIPQNTFSGNLGYGLAITGRAHDNQVIDSFIGTDTLGRYALGNGRGGVLVAGTAYRNAIGTLGTKPPSNLISGNHGNGVTLLTGTSFNRVVNNYIGLDRTGRLPLPNTGRPIVNLGRHNLILANRT